jgi:hypothetical protein
MQVLIGYVWKICALGAALGLVSACGGDSGSDKKGGEGGAPPAAGGASGAGEGGAGASEGGSAGSSGATVTLEQLRDACRPGCVKDLELDCSVFSKNCDLAPCGVDACVDECVAFSEVVPACTQQLYAHRNCMGKEDVEIYCDEDNSTVRGCDAERAELDACVESQL